MPNIQVGDVIKMVVACKEEGQYSINVRWWRCTAIAGASVTALQALAHLGPLLAPLYKAVLTNNASFYGLSIQTMFPTALQMEYRTADNGAGTAGAESMSSQTCGLIKFLSGMAGRSFRGRMYVPFPSESNNDADGYPDAVYLANITALGVQLATVQVVNPGGGNTATLQPCLVTVPAYTTVDILASSGRGEWATQRRRSQINRSDTPPF